MNLRLPKPSAKMSLAIATFTILGAVAGAGILYIAIEDSLVKNSPSVSSEPATEDVAPPITVESSSDQLPEGVITPQQLVEKANEYVGKEVKVRGQIVEMEPGQYLLGGQSRENNRAISLNFDGSDVDPAPYVSAYSDPAASPNQSGGPVTVTVIVSNDAVGNPSQPSGYSYKVKAIEQ